METKFHFHGNISIFHGNLYILLISMEKWKRFHGKLTKYPWKLINNSHSTAPHAATTRGSATSGTRAASAT